MSDWRKATTKMPMWWPEWLVGVVGRTGCRVLGWHNETCRGWCPAERRKLSLARRYDIPEAVP
jgi:hypothetical protein